MSSDGLVYVTSTQICRSVFTARPHRVHRAATHFGQSGRVVRHLIYVAVCASVVAISGCGSSPSTESQTAASPISPTTTLVHPTATDPVITAPLDLAPYALSWTVDPSAALDASTTIIPLVVMDTRCSGGVSPQVRLLPVKITYSDDSIGIAIMATPLPGFQACPVAPTASVTVTLDQPLGDRTLVDLGVGSA